MDGAKGGFSTSSADPCGRAACVCEDRFFYQSHAESRQSTSTRWSTHSSAGVHEERPVKYVGLIYNNPSTWRAMPKPERDRVMAIHFRLIDELKASGELIRVDGLRDSANTKPVRLVSGSPVVTDGPFS